MGTNLKQTWAFHFPTVFLRFYKNHLICVQISLKEKVELQMNMLIDKLLEGIIDDSLYKKTKAIMLLLISRIRFELNMVTYSTIDSNKEMIYK